jgi:DNA-binding Lrp family transcriptional regulator
MPVSAYVFVLTEMDQTSAVAEAIREIDGVDDVDVVTGPYDVIVKASADTMDELGQMVVRSVQKVPGINRTITSPVINL